MTKFNEENLQKRILRWFSTSIIDIDPGELFNGLDFDRLEQIIYSDYDRYFPAQTPDIDNLERRLELVGIVLYRYANFCYAQNLGEIRAEKFSNLARFLCGFEIYYTANIGPALKINHGLGSVIGARSKLGSGVLLHQGVTIGGKNDSRPEIGDNVTIYAGAKILGGILIGPGAIIGANCVCIESVPENAVVAGIPGEIIKIIQ